MNIVAKKTRTDGKDVIETVKTYDEETKEFGFFQRLIRYLKGGECKIGDWLPIRSDDYTAEESPQITYDNHP